MPEAGSRGLVYRTLRHEPTPRVPRHLWTLPWAQQQHAAELAAIQRAFPNDIETPPLRSAPVPGTFGDRYAAGVSVDEWGCEFFNLCPGVIGEMKNPRIRDYSRDLDTLRPPREWLSADLGYVDDLYARSERFMLAMPGVNPFERMQWLRGTENLFIDLIERPPGLIELRDRIDAWNIAMIQKWCETRVDAIGWADDWGTQRAMLIHPDLWRELFKPLYRRYAELIHAAGKFAFMHSDGNIEAILDDLIEIGVDALNSQLFCMDIEAIGRRYKGRITFWGEIDRQHVLPFGDLDEARAAVRRVANALYDGRGGTIAQLEFGPGCRPESVRAVFEEWERVGAEFTGR